MRVQPNGDGLGRDTYSKLVPDIFLVFHVDGRVVLGGIHAVDAANARDRAAPAAGNQRGMLVAHWKGEQRKEVRAINLHGLILNFVIGLGQALFVIPMDTGNNFSAINVDDSVFPADYPTTRVVRLFPSGKIFAIEEWLPLGAAAGGGEDDSSEDDEFFHGQFLMSASSWDLPDLSLALWLAISFEISASTSG